MIGDLKLWGSEINHKEASLGKTVPHSGVLDFTLVSSQVRYEF